VPYVLCREQENFQSSRNDCTLCYGRIKLCHCIIAICSTRKVCKIWLCVGMVLRTTVPYSIQISLDASVALSGRSGETGNLKSRKHVQKEAPTPVLASLHFSASYGIYERKIRPYSTFMDFSDVGVRHAVAFTELKIKHSVDISPSTLSFAKELRYCVIVVVVGLTTASIVRSVLDYKRRQS
jgi:hypothetical protein